MKLLLKNLLFTVLVPGTVAVWVPWYFVHGQQRPSTMSFILASPPFAAAVIVYLWTVANFARIGRGTPAPIDAPKKPIVQGPHRCVRNPMYLAVLSGILSWAIAFQSVSLLLYLAAIALAFHMAVLFIEEPTLNRQFGEDYAVYRANVHRWLPGRSYTPSTAK